MPIGKLCFVNQSIHVRLSNFHSLSGSSQVLLTQTAFVCSEVWVYNFSS